MTSHRFTEEQLDLMATEFYGAANDLAYEAGPTPYAPARRWSKEDHALWRHYIDIAEAISALPHRGD